MRNHAPIFVNGFSRGGSNILVNLILSHPDICYPSGELQNVFKGGAVSDGWTRTLYKRLLYDLPVSVAARQIVLSPNNLRARPRLPEWCRTYMDWVLYREKLAARHEWHNYYKREGVCYSDDEIKRSRLLCKSLNGLVFMTDNFAATYSDATFYGLIRNGLAVCEGHVRRGRSPERIGKWYDSIAAEMLRNAERMENYHLIRFEDILEDPIGEMKRIHNDTKLDESKIEKIRLQMKAVLAESGQHQLKKGYDRQVVWYAVDEVKSHFDSSIDKIQIENLSTRDGNAFLKFAGKTMEKLGYL